MNSEQDQIISAVNKTVLTSEQAAIIDSDANIKINAVAGSGKTFTLIEYAAARPPSAKILYLAFNKSVRLEAQRKFAHRHLRNVTVETAHSLAFKHIVRNHKYQVRPHGYQTHEIVELLNLKGNHEKLTEYVIANHIGKFVTYFCNSDKLKVQDLDYLDTVSDPKAISFVRTFYKLMLDGTRMLLAKMDKGEIEIIHDFYLKKFQLSKPLLDYDYILFDEGQDASAAMLDVFFYQKAIKIIVGDTHQQIYGWRYAVNSLEKTDFRALQLSNSFRFHQDIANLANELLKWKKHIGKENSVAVTGSGSSQTEISKATMARTNLGLLLEAINYTADNPKLRHIYFEGNINSYTYADEGASLYDVLKLYNYRHDSIRDKLIKSMKNMRELEEYIEKTEDAQLAMMVEIVKEYGNEIPALIKKLKELHTGDEEKSKAEMIFSTVHRAKGMEYDVVYLVNDFIKEADLEKPKAGKQEPLPDIAKLNEEINLLYVAVTRAKTKLFCPEALMPKNIPPSPYITVVKPSTFEAASIGTPFSKREQKDQSKKWASAKDLKEKAYSVAKKRETHKDAYKPWTPELDQELKRLFGGDNPIGAIAAHFGRTKRAIIARLRKLDCFNARS